MAKEEQKEDTSLPAPEEKGREKESEAFEGTFTQYVNSTAGLREFFSRLSPLVVKMKKGIAKEREARRREIAEDFVRGAKKKDIGELRKLVDSFQPLTNKPTPDTKPIAFEIKSAAIGEYLLKVLRHSRYYTPEDIHRELLNRSILMSLVSYFEVLVADLAGLHPYG